MYTPTARVARVAAKELRKKEIKRSIRGVNVFHEIVVNGNNRRTLSPTIPTQTSALLLDYLSVVGANLGIGSH